MSRIARHIIVVGRVQGVFYRAWTKANARELGLTGWVRNCADGSVEALLEGEPDAIGLMVERMRDGPLDAEVSHLREEPAEPSRALSFDIRR